MADDATDVTQAAPPPIPLPPIPADGDTSYGALAHPGGLTEPAQPGWFSQAWSSIGDLGQGFAGAVAPGATKKIGEAQADTGLGPSGPVAPTPAPVPSIPSATAPAEDDVLKSLGPATPEDMATLASPEAPRPEALPGGPSPLLDAMGHYLQRGEYAADVDTRVNAYRDSIAGHIQNVKDASGVDIPDPTQGGFQAEAIQEVMGRIKSGDLPPNPLGVAAYTDEVQKTQYQLYQNALTDLADRYKGNSPQDVEIRSAIDAATSMKDYADRWVTNTGKIAAMEYARTQGEIIPWLATTASEFLGEQRSKMGVLSLIASFAMPEIGVAKKIESFLGPEVGASRKGAGGVQRRLPQVGRIQRRDDST